MKINSLLFISVALFFLSCSDDVLPKPKAFLRLEYPTNSYQKIESDCPYSFQIAKGATAVLEPNCWMKIKYPKLKATIHITYRKVDNNLNAVLKEVEKLTYEHTVKADAINAPKLYENKLKNVYGSMIHIEGDVASNVQFHVTDSVKNVLYGALYFKVKPNYDSILPAIKYVEKDIKNLMETIEWNNN